MSVLPCPVCGSPLVIREEIRAEPTMSGRIVAEVASCAPPCTFWQTIWKGSEELHQIRKAWIATGEPPPAGEPPSAIPEPSQALPQDEQRKRGNT